MEYHFLLFTDLPRPIFFLSPYYTYVYEGCNGGAGGNEEDGGSSDKL